MNLRRLVLTLALCAAQGTSAWAQSEGDLATLRATLDQAVSEFEGPQ